MDNEQDNKRNLVGSKHQQTKARDDAFKRARGAKKQAAKLKKRAKKRGAIPARFFVDASPSSNLNTVYAPAAPVSTVAAVQAPSIRPRRLIALSDALMPYGLLAPLIPIVYDYAQARMVTFNPFQDALHLTRIGELDPNHPKRQAQDNVDRFFPASQDVRCLTAVTAVRGGYVEDSIQAADGSQWKLHFPVCSVFNDIRNERPASSHIEAPTICAPAGAVMIGAPWKYPCVVSYVPAVEAESHIENTSSSSKRQVRVTPSPKDNRIPAVRVIGKDTQSALMISFVGEFPSPFATPWERRTEIVDTSCVSEISMRRTYISLTLSTPEAQEYEALYLPCIGPDNEPYDAFQGFAVTECLEVERTRLLLLLQTDPAQLPIPPIMRREENGEPIFAKPLETTATVRPTFPIGSISTGAATATAAAAAAALASAGTPTPKEAAPSSSPAGFTVTAGAGHKNVNPLLRMSLFGSYSNIHGLDWKSPHPSSQLTASSVATATARGTSAPAPASSPASTMSSRAASLNRGAHAAVNPTEETESADLLKEFGLLPPDAQ